MKNFENSLNYTVKEGEINTLPSLTVPEMTMSLKELLARYTRGQSVATLTPVYLGEDEEFAEYDNLDRIEKIQLAKDNKMHVEAMREEIQRRTTKREEKTPEAPKTTSESDAKTDAASDSAVASKEK